jgi:hypothetical protein
MRAVRNTTDLLVLEGASPLFRPFFVGGLGLLVVGTSLLVGRVFGHWSTVGSPSGSYEAAPVAGLGAFLATFGLFVAIVPMVGRFPYRREIIVDRAVARLVRRDRTLLRLRQETYPLDQVQGVEVEEARHVDGDPYFSLLLRLESGETVTLDRFTDGTAAGAAAGLIREHLVPVRSPEPNRPVRLES